METALATPRWQFTGAGVFQLIEAECIHCGRCQKGCPFLKVNSTPGEMAKAYRSKGNTHLRTSFDCSLCSLCTVLCPQDLPVAAMMLELRRSAVAQGGGRYRNHRRLRFFETVGNSTLFSYYHIPENCDAILFPGCGLAGIRPEHVAQLYLLLRSKIQGLGIVLDCCNKPSHDLGEQKKFAAVITQKLKRLEHLGVNNIITGCPSCLNIFREYAKGFRVSMIYEHIASRAIAAKQPVGQEGTAQEHFIHDPCTTRFDGDLHDKVRRLAAAGGVVVKEKTDCRRGTLCCGEGGGAAVMRDYGEQDWNSQLRRQIGDSPVITYCSGCLSRLHGVKARHVVDLLFPELVISKRSRPPATYVNRLLLKKKLAGTLES